jgi:hypothetical protein
MGRYAESTSVSSQASRDEIERTLRRYGADQFMYGWDATMAVIRFRAHERYVEFRLGLPDRHAREITHTPNRGTVRSLSQQEREYEQAVRQRWRALALVVKAKLEAVAAGITEFEDEFLAHLILPDGTTVGRHVRPMVEEAYTTGKMPAEMLALPAPRGDT